MKILLIRPPDTGLGKFKDLAVAQHPINLVYLATFVKKDHEVSILDLQAISLTKEELFFYIKEKNPDIVGITFMTCNFNSVRQITDISKKLDKIVILGGPHPTIMTEQTLQEIDADILIRGEGELTFKEILKNLSKKKSLKDIKGISYKKNGKVIHNPARPYIKNLDILPVPDRSLLNLKKYCGGSTPGITKTSTVMFTSRGCPFPCIFCSARFIHGAAYRTRSMNHIFKEVDDIINLGINHITIDDDNFTFNKERVSEFCDKIKKYKITWDCDSRVGLSKEILKKMKDSGCEKIAFGVESGSQRILNIIRKNINLDLIIETFKHSQEVGMKTQAFFMIGHPTETKQDVDLTFKLIKEIKPTYLFLSLATPYPGTPLYDYMLKKGFIDKDIDWSKFTFFGSNSAWRNENFTKEQLINMRNKIYRKFYLSPGYIICSLSNMKNLKDCKYLITGAKSLFNFLKK